MKKYFLMAIMAATTLAFVSCDKKEKEADDPGEKTENKIIMSEDSAKIYIGEEYELAASLNPAAKGVEISWTSNKLEVATVDNGVVYGIAEGTAVITASAEGYTAASCTITVVDMYKDIAWEGCELWNIHEKDGDIIVLNPDTQKIVLNNGDTVPCLLGSAYALLWSEGITFDGQRLSGAGILSQIDIPAYLLVDDGKYAQYYGTPIGSGFIAITDSANYDPTDPYFAYVSPIAKLISAEKHYAYLTGASDEEGITGPTLEWVNFSDQTDYAPYLGLVGSGIFYEEDAFYYAVVMGWFQDAAYGLAINEAGDDIKQPYEFAPVKAYAYQQLPSQAAPARRAPARHTTAVKVDKNNATSAARVASFAGEKAPSFRMAKKL